MLSACVALAPATTGIDKVVSVSTLKSNCRPYWQFLYTYFTYKCVYSYTHIWTYFVLYICWYILLLLLLLLCSVWHVWVSLTCFRLRRQQFIFIFSFCNPTAILSGHPFGRARPSALSLLLSVEKSTAHNHLWHALQLCRF